MRIDDLMGQGAKQTLAEIHYTDLYPASFEAFRKKYAKIVKDGQGDGLYVQFTNHADSTLDRTAFQNPDHADMVGVYGYPIDYVLKHPADIWYGRNARYLRVLSSRSRKTLMVQQIGDAGQARYLLTQMGFDRDTVWRMWMHAEKNLTDNKNANSVGRTFLSCLQWNLETPNPVERRLRTGVEQTQLLRRAGFDAILDTATKAKDAVINEREPEQICFLTRAAFRVVEVVDLRGGWRDSQLGALEAGDLGSTPVERKLVALIAAQMGDKLAEGPDGVQGVNFYWTKGGRRIEIEFQKPLSRLEKQGLGGKLHRADKLTDPSYAMITVRTEVGAMFFTLSRKDKTKDVLAKVAPQWAELQASPRPPHTRLEPETRQSYHAKIKAEADAKWQAQRERENAQKLQKLPGILDDIAWAANRYGLPFDPPAENARLAFCHVLDDLPYALSPDQMGDGSPGDSLLNGVASYRTPVLAAARPQAEQVAAVLDAMWPEISERSWVLRNVRKAGPDLFGVAREALEDDTVAS